MARYFFHCRGQDEFIPDESGAEMLDRNAAFESARLIVQRMLTRAPQEWVGWVMEVSDDTGRVLSVVPFSYPTAH